MYENLYSVNGNYIKISINTNYKAFKFKLSCMLVQGL